ncbi:hypothetical protein [Herbiconiux sp.]|uniref:hypothetical protein n=1 Tax=Herbiconiux sp. TaxID=1871186 RepID=UPI0025C5D03C|nr:hypothetical protein [Herbiconiux sp.]
MTGLTMVGGAGMNCEGDSCAIPSADAVTGAPDAEPATGSETMVAEPAGVSAE